MKKYLFGTLVIALSTLVQAESQTNDFSSQSTYDKWASESPIKQTVKSNIPAYSFVTAGWLSSPWSQNSLANVYASAGAGRRFILEDHHQLSLEAVGGNAYGILSTLALKTGYMYRFADRLDLSSLYLGMNVHYGVMREGFKRRQVIEEYYRERYPDQDIKLNHTFSYTKPEFVLGYEIRKADRAPRFVEAGFRASGPIPQSFSLTFGQGF